MRGVRYVRRNTWTIIVIMASVAVTRSVPCPFDESVMRVVRYLCSCGMAQPLPRLYFCRHCLELRCGFCVSHEVDSHYCPNCLENMPSAEARLKKNRCANCFDCPSCGHTLSTRATSVPVPSAEDPTKVVPKKVYYLACSYCRWTSRDIGLPDQNVASGGWPDVENPHGARLAVLQEHYRALAQREKLERESKRYLGGRSKMSYMQLSDKYGLNAAMARKRAGLPPLSQQHAASAAGATDAAGQPAEMSPSVPVDISEVEEKSVEDLFESAVDLTQVTCLGQRFMQMESQPPGVNELFPRHKHLMIKRSQRCRKCEHNLCKPEYNPSSIKFKIQLAAYYHVPEVVLFRVEKPLKPGAKSLFVLKLVNPTQHPTKVEFVSMDDFAKEAEIAEAKEEQRKREQAAAAGDKKTSSGLLRNPSLVRASARHRVASNAECFLPPRAGAPVYLPPRDDAAEFDDAGPDLKGVVDDAAVVAWRKGNKVGVFLSATPGEKLGSGDEVVVEFALKFVYTNTISALEKKEVQTADILVPVYIVLGTIE